MSALDRLHDVAWIDPARGYRLIGSRDTLDEADRLARRFLRDVAARVVILTKQGDAPLRAVTRAYVRRWRWWPFAVRVIPYSDLTPRLQRSVIS